MFDLKTDPKECVNVHRKKKYKVRYKRGTCKVGGIKEPLAIQSTFEIFDLIQEKFFELKEKLFQWQKSTYDPWQQDLCDKTFCEIIYFIFFV